MQLPPLHSQSAKAVGTSTSSPPILYNSSRCQYHTHAPVCLSLAINVEKPLRQSPCAVLA